MDRSWKSGMSLKDFFYSLFRRGAGTSGDVGGAGAPTPGGLSPNNSNEPAQICSPKVLLIIFNPVMDPATGKRLAAEMHWSRPDDLVSRFIAEVLQASGGLVRYQVTQRIEVDEFPALADGFRYDAHSYAAVLRAAVAPHSPAQIDYLEILSRFEVLRKIESRQIDELWIMGFPHAGLYESIMAGSKAFWCNAPPLTQTGGKRRFVIMGFSFERDIGEMLHSYNHRSEAILAKLYNSFAFLAWAYKANRLPATIKPDQDLNPFERYILFDQIAPGRAGVGSVHYAPNAVRDYDLGSPGLVPSTCYDWLSFPELRGDVRMVSASEWGGGSERAYQRWWMNHLPRAAGRQNGIHNNWWQYIADLDNLAD